MNLTVECLFQLEDGADSEILRSHILAESKFGESKSEHFQRLIEEFYEAREEVDRMRKYYRTFCSIKLKDLAKTIDAKSAQPPQSMLFFRFDRKKEDDQIYNLLTKRTIGQDDREFFSLFIDDFLAGKTDEDQRIQFITDNCMMAKKNAIMSTKGAYLIKKKV